MFQTIIIGIDGRPQDAEALALAQQLAEPGAEIIAAKIAVIDTGLLRTSPVRFEAEALEAAEDVVDAFTEPRVRTEGVVTCAASVGQGLCEVAVGASADLIVIASSRRGLAGRVFAGDAVRDVLRHAPCPVAIATVGQTAAGALKHITVGYDGSEASETALAEAVRIGERDHAAVDVVEVVEPALAVAAMGGAYSGNALDDQYERAHQHLEGIVERHGVHGVIATGRAAHELAKASRSSDLLVIGLRNYDLLDRMLIGSTGHALLREQSAPMLITPPGEDSHNVATDALDDADAI